jgi:L-ascorbate metabolism protein UlaG (beta-lactamase superfamily)
VLAIPEGPTVYHAGDTTVFGDMTLIGELYQPDIALLPIGGYYTMGPVGAAKAARLLGVDTVVPIHYGTFPILAGTPEELTEEARGDFEVFACTPGEPVA